MIIKKLDEYENLYNISSNGEIFSVKKGLLKPFKSKNGYYVVTLTKNKKQKKYLLHRLVAISFIPNPEYRLEVNHIDGDKRNNSISNLEWNTSKENHVHATNNQLKAHGSNHGMSKINESDVLNIRNEYSNNNVTLKEIGEKYNLSESAIHLIVSRKNWKHI